MLEIHVELWIRGGKTSTYCLFSDLVESSCDYVSVPDEIKVSIHKTEFVFRLRSGHDKDGWKVLLKPEREKDWTIFTRAELATKYTLPYDYLYSTRTISEDNRIIQRLVDA